MSKVRSLPRLLAISVTLACGLAPLAHADQPAIETSNGKAFIRTNDAAPAYQMRILYPDGRVFERDLLGGETLAIDPKGPGDALVDGQYQFELSPILGVNTRKEADRETLASAPATIDTISGTFRVEKGAILPWSGKVDAKNDVDYGVQMKDVVHADDTIVQGSICVGFDCVNNENFGADTIRLKENNLRIHFDDTSSTGSFPSNDWRIVANDQASGGASYLAIEDTTAGRQIVRVTAGAPANSLYVANTGNVGLGTSTPVLDLHITNGNTPAIRLEQDGTGGFTAQTWDIGSNEANFFVRDVTGGSKLPFKIIPGAPTNSLYVAADGDIGLGTGSPGARLDVAGTTSLPRPISRIAGGSAGTAPAWTNDDVAVFENDATLGTVVELFSADAKFSGIGFSNNTTRFDGAITYVNSSDTMFLRAGNGPTAIRIPATGIVTFPQGIGTTTVQGDLTVTGTLTPDYVFEEGFKVMPIEDHAAFMWQNKHLPMVEAAKIDASGKGVVNVGLRSQQLLEELEYAHVYIDQLHQRLKALETQQAETNALLRSLINARASDSNTKDRQ